VTIYLIVGLPGAGKTTRAKELEVSESALRLTPDDWQMAVFDGDGPTQWRTKERAGHRDRIEGKLVEIGMRAAQLGIDVVFDFGLWGRDERSALRWIASSLGVRAQVVYLPIDYEEQRRRITDRYGSGPGHFRMSDAELKEWQVVFQAPDDDELRGDQIPDVPPGHATWSQWASERWPSLPLTEAPVREPVVDEPAALTDIIEFTWRGPISDEEMVELVRSHGGRPSPGWWGQIRRHSLGWVDARDGAGLLVGFVNVAWDGGDHAFLLDTKTRGTRQRRGIGRELVRLAVLRAKAAGCEWLHVDFTPDLDTFYLGACGFRRTDAGLIHLTEEQVPR